MEFSDFATVLYQIAKPMNKDGHSMGKAPFIRQLLSLNCEKTADLGFLDSPDSTVFTYLKRSLSANIATELLKVMEQTEFIKWIDALGDEQQELLYNQLSKYHSNVDYENLSEFCADILKTIIQEAVCKERNSHRIDDDIPDHKQSDEILAELIKLWNKPKNVWIIHYTSTNINDPIYPARITCLAFRPLSDTSTKSFSIFDEAQKIHLKIEKIPQNLDLLECNMLSHFFEYVQNLHHPTWLHWNMRNAQYGFDAIENRYQYLTDKTNQHVPGKRIDIAGAFKKIYGSNYADHPRLQSVCKLNDISLLCFVTGKEEAQAFQNCEYNKIQNSLFRKINCIHSLMQKCVDYSLITNHTINTSFHVSGCMECPFHEVNCV